MEPEWLVNSQGLTLFYTLASIHDSMLQRPKHGLQIQTLNLAACGGTFLTGLTPLTRFFLYPEHPVYPV